MPTRSILTTLVALTTVLFFATPGFAKQHGKKGHHGDEHHHTAKAKKKGKKGKHHDAEDDDDDDGHHAARGHGRNHARAPHGRGENLHHANGEHHGKADDDHHAAMGHGHPAHTKQMAKERDKHLMRLAKIDRIGQIADKNGNDTLRKKADMLRTKENRRHQKAMKRLENGKPAASDDDHGKADAKKDGKRKDDDHKKAKE